MKCKVGDLVHVKQTEMEGTVLGEEQETMYQVKIGSIVAAVFKEQLEAPQFDWDGNEKDRYKNLKFKSAVQHFDEKEVAKMQQDAGVFLAFFPIYTDKSKTDIHQFRMYLINQDKEKLSFSYKQRLQTEQLFAVKGQTLPYTNSFLQEISMEQLHLMPTFDLKIRYDKDAADVHSFKDEIRLRPKKLFDYLELLQTGSHTYFQVPLEIDFLAKVEVLKGADIAIGKDKSNNNPILSIPKYVREIDLHIENLRTSHSHLSNAEIIQIQMQTFETALAKAIHNGQSDLTVIHGVGKGVLKDAIHQVLKAEIHVRHFICDWSPKYGNGATQVFFN